MIFAKAIEEALNAARDEKFPEVGIIKVGFDYQSEEKTIIHIAPGNVQTVQAGRCAFAGMKQEALVSIIRFIRDEDSNVAAVECEKSANKVHSALIENSTLVSAPHPNGFCKSSRVSMIEPGEDIVGSPCVIRVITISACYFMERGT